MKKIIQWYFDTFLPFENPEHPLYYKHEEEEWDEWIPDFSYPIEKDEST